MPIAVRDYGGSGQAILLLHGAGGNLASWDVVGPLLAADHHAVAVDLRGHGESGDGPWSWAAVIADLEAVVEELDLRQPAVVGHSLGGGLAARWARQHPDCPAVVNLDGHRSPVTSPENLDAAAAGVPLEKLCEDMARLDAQFDAQMAAMAVPFSDEQVEAMLAARRAVAVQCGTDPDRWEVVARRGLARRDGATYLRPDLATTQALRGSVQSDSLPVFAEVEVPVLLVVATRSLPEVPPDLEPLMVAFRAGLRRDLAALVATRPHVEVREIDASHGVLFEKPQEVTEIITGYLDLPSRAR
ncbi:hypothetical protein GCM10009765_68630 [Fodinicola feengrottensis]|uniref:AB hydrolase-1 domain-containing protein n=1 Tax=Fodinicola feengrottensis TaxID=435914 RepID=A0ABN2IQT7_9ACTN